MRFKSFYSVVLVNLKLAFLRTSENAGGTTAPGAQRLRVRDGGTTLAPRTVRASPSNSEPCNHKERFKTT